MIGARNFHGLRAAFLAWLIACLAFGAALLSAAVPVNAQEVRFGDENIAVELYTDGAPVAGEEWMLALRFTPDTSRGEEWHGYWSNPGDAGQGMQLTLNLPEGWEQGAALYSVPQRFVQPLEGSAGLMNHIYKGDFTVLVPVKVPADADVSSARRVTGFVQYLACSDILCVPQDADLISKQAAEPAEFARWRAATAPLLDADASFEIADTTLRIAIPLPDGVELSDPHVFVENAQLVDYIAPQSLARLDDMLIADIPLSELAKDASDRVSGILAFGDGIGVRFEANKGGVPTGGEPVAAYHTPAETPSIWLLLLGALAGGLILNIMPCVFPILSIKALALAKAGGDEGQARSDALAYTAGVVLACVALGGIMLALRAGGEQVGWAFQLQSPGVVALLLALAILITVNFAGMFELPQLSVTGGAGKSSSFATGLLAAFVATPCTGPFMAAALGA
ncbi:MAG: protein-disulfide reductase DsbD domain-containing protein, partial [Erythrobacter sp.]